MDGDTVALPGERLRDGTADPSSRAGDQDRPSAHLTDPRRSIPRVGVDSEGVQDRVVTTNLDTLATALYVKTDDLLKESPIWPRGVPRLGIAPQFSDAELVTLAVMQALLGFTSEARWLRHARNASAPLVPVPAEPARVQQAAAGRCRPDLGGDPGPGRGHQLVDRRRVGSGLHPGRMRPIPETATLRAGRMGRIRVLRLTFALLLGTAAASDRHPGRPADRVRADWRQSRRTRNPARHLGRRPDPARQKTGTNRHRRQELLRRGVRNRPRRRRTACCARHAKASPNAPVPGSSNHCAKPSNRSTRPSKANSTSNDTAHTPAGVIVRILQRVLALTAAIWHNDQTSAPAPPIPDRLRPLTLE